MSKFAIVLTLASTAMLAVTPTTNAADNKATKVVCLGDSITRGGYPKHLGEILHVEAINAGSGGNPSKSGLSRLANDVLAKEPDAVVILFGTNDSRIDEPSVYATPQQYAQNLTKMVQICRQKKIKVLLCTLPPINQVPYFQRHKKEAFDKAGGLDKMLAEYRQAALDVGKATETPVVDLNHLLADDLSWRSKDGVHPTPEGYELVARVIADSLAPLLGLKSERKTK